MKLLSMENLYFLYILSNISILNKNLSWSVAKYKKDIYLSVLSYKQEGASLHHFDFILWHWQNWWNWVFSMEIPAACFGDVALLPKLHQSVDICTFQSMWVLNMPCSCPVSGFAICLGMLHLITYWTFTKFLSSAFGKNITGKSVSIWPPKFIHFFTAADFVLSRKKKRGWVM